MQKRLLIFFLFFSTLLKAQQIDVLHYSFYLELSDTSDSLKGLAQVTFVHRDTGGFVRFDLKGPGRWGKGMTLRSVTGADESVCLRCRQLPGQIEIPTPGAKPGDTVSLRIAYEGSPGDGLIISKNKFGDRTFFADNWPNRAHHWLPCKDSVDDKASFEFIVRAPAKYRVISNGIKVQENLEANNTRLTHWRENVALSTKVMVIGAARFAVKTYADSPPNIPVTAWVYPQDSAKGVYDFAPATEMVRFFSDYIAPFPYNKLANVQSTTIFGGMENASCIFYDENLVTGDRSGEGTVAHEIAHQWFGDMASEKSFAHLWLSEGFANYFTDLWMEKKYGKKTFYNRLQEAREKIIDFNRMTTHPVVDSTSDLMSL
ncbi:MAG TPA: M1 family metallopeptidase, partial [Flavisolibacter sp.]|nr:M1 family metallopeptidase [Flavisolibacter sp.]